MIKTPSKVEKLWRAFRKSHYNKMQGEKGKWSTKDIFLAKQQYVNYVIFYVDYATSIDFYYKYDKINVN
jgi:hypothetical protein